MEFSFVQTQTFLHFLSNSGILSEKQQNSLFEDYSHSSSRKFIFILADFFKKLTPSDAYDLAFRLFTKWEKQSENRHISSEKINNSKEKINDISTENLLIKKPENYKLTIRNHKFANFLYKMEKKLMKNSFFMIKKREKRVSKENYMVQLEDFRNFNQKNVRKNQFFEGIYEGPRPFIVTPEEKISQISQKSEQNTLRNIVNINAKSEEKISQNNQRITIPNIVNIHEKLYKEAHLKKIDAIYRENVKKKNEIQGCTFRPNLKNSEEKHKENCDFFSVNSNNHGNCSNTNQTTSTQNNDFAMRYEKLYSENAQRKQNIIEKMKIEEENVMKECTFQPKISKMRKCDKNKENIEICDKKTDVLKEKNQDILNEKKRDVLKENGDIFKEKRSFSSKKRAFSNHEKSADNFRSNKKIQSIYRESDFIAKNL